MGNGWNEFGSKVKVNVKANKLFDMAWAEEGLTDRLFRILWLEKAQTKRV